MGLMMAATTGVKVMRTTLPETLEAGRDRVGHYATLPGEPFGRFLVQGPCQERLLMIAHDGDGEAEGWEHVSVSTARRVPNWTEMCFVKALFWEPEDCVVQFHPPQSQYVNNHPFVLHLWRQRSGFPTPPSIFVGDKTKGVLTAREAKALREGR
jgi:hypothetical protein